MRITILQGAFLPVPALRGGAIEKAWESLGQEFSKNGHEVTHVSRLCDGLPESEKIGKVSHFRVKGADAVRNPWILKLLELPYVLRARKVLPLADVLVTHSFWAPLFLPRKRNGKLYLHVGRYPKGQVRLYRKASRFQVPSKAIARAVALEAPHREKEISVLPYPLGWNLPMVRPLSDRPKRILYAGRLHPEKGVAELLDAFGRIHEKKRAGWSLRIMGPWRQEHGGAGKGYLDSLRNNSAKIGPAVEIIDPVFDENDLLEQYGQTRVFAYPSLAEKGETFGLSALEAMSCGCVPLVSSLACFSEFIDPPGSGFVFDHSSPGRVEALKAALVAIMQADQAGRLEPVSVQARKIAERYELGKVASLYLDDFAALSA